MSDTIEHTGTVIRTRGNCVEVRIVSQSACGACQARQACGMAESEEKMVEVYSPHAEEFKEGDLVRVGVRRQAGAIAVLLGYVGALLTLLVVLFTTVGVFGWDEGKGALASLVGVALYYVVLWMARKKIDNTIHFTINKN